MVDGATEARQAHGRTLSIELRRAPQRGLPAMESQRQPNERPRQHHVEAEQRTGACEASTAKVEEHVQEAVHSLCGCGITQPSCSGAREAEG